MPASPLCRENPERAIYLNDLIGNPLLNAVTPEILKLRARSSDPITVYINSEGGSPDLADTIWDLLSAPNADGNACPLVTVATGWAASAAADFLAKGGYVIAYPTATVYFHGTRQQRKDALTMEKASSTAKMLREHNDMLAVDLARNIIRRSVFIYLSLRDTFKELCDEAGQDLPDITCFAHALNERLSPSASSLPIRALKRYGEMQKLSDYVFEKVKPSKASIAKTQRQILRAVIDYEYRATKKNPFWTFTEENLERIVEDFRLIEDFYTGDHYGFMMPMVKQFGNFFLSAEDTAEFATKQFADHEERGDWLVQKAANEVQPLWYFVVSICRLLQQKENPLTAYDAYWLGIVHEVVGGDLPCVRNVVENPPEPSNAAQNPQA